MQVALTGVETRASSLWPRWHRRSAPTGARPARRRAERDRRPIIKLTRAEQDPGTPPAIANHARSILDSVRQVARGIYPPMFADSGVVEALRAQAVRASVHMSLAGTPLRSIQAAETALYFSCLEAIQNVANHAGRTAPASLGLHHEHGVLAVRGEDEGRGFDSEDTPRRCGPEEYSRAYPSARRHRHAHLRPRGLAPS
jgi:anti-sigma regulatory factor (Ser/Thr protein kinase)